VSLPADDRGFTLGDGLFETVLARNGELVLWEAHMDRLARGCAALGLPAPDLQACRITAEEELADAGLKASRAAVRISWSAGSGGRGLDRPARIVPRLVAQAAPAPRPQGPAALSIVSVRRNETSPASRLKALSYLDQVLARREAQAMGADEAVMLNGRGELACCGAANLFWLRDRTLSTPALDCGVLDGIMRAALISAARAEGYEVREVRARPAELEDADAVFMTNSLIGVRAVCALDERRYDMEPAVAALIEHLV
jgi:branched-chain amino acid aminotransferase/4-amino-4-deoxychorismate lyase